MTTRPIRHVMRNCALFIDGEDYLGTVTEITIPTLTVKTDEHRGAGMAMPIDCHLGYERPELSFQMPVLDPAVMREFGLAPGVLKRFLAKAATKDEDGTTHSASCMMLGFMTEVDLGGWTPGEKAEATFKVSVREFDYSYDGQPVISVTPFDVLIGGVSQYADIRTGLGLA